MTFLFTDVVGSTLLWAEHHDEMEADLVAHDQLVRSSIEARDGYVFSTAGDAFAAAFTRPVDAIGAAIQAQRGLGSAEWTLPNGLGVRMGIHTGAATERGGDYFGPTLNESARLMSAAHGGQIVMSSRTHELAPDVPSVCLGAHRLRDLLEPIEIYQVVADGIDGEFPPLRSLGVGLSTLPEHRSSFVGRREEIDRVRSKLAEGRLVTLTGVGGVGKTRLAVESAAEELPNHPGGVFFVDLAAIGEPDEVVAAVLSGIGLTGTDPSRYRSELVKFIETRTLLLLIDNCEHLLDPVAELVDDLMQHAPHLRVLATSRQALNIEGERVIRVPPLDAEREASRLFVDRAIGVGATFDPVSERSIVAELCSRLDGIPLAIELTATATLILSPAELLAGLDDRFTLLLGGRRRAPDRQRTLEATIDWSHDLLDEDEQVAFRRLGVFAGPFVLDVVPHVLGLPSDQALAMLERLVAKSLVLPFRIDRQRTGFRLLETLRVYALRKLTAAGERETTSARRADAFIDWVESSWVAAMRNEWTFWRCYRAQIPDISQVAGDLLEAGRIKELTALLGTSINGSGNASWDAERLRLLDLIDVHHLAELDLPDRAHIVGYHAVALMNAGHLIEFGRRATSDWTEYDSLPMVERRMLVANRVIIMSLVDPSEGIRLADAALAELGSSLTEETWRHHLLYLKAICIAARGDFEGAAQIAEQAFVPQDCELRDFALTTWLWFSHLAGAQVDAERLAMARSADPRDGFWRPSVCISAAMHAPSAEAIAGELVAIADRGWNGLLQFEEAEYLAAFARLAQMRGDADRARELLAFTMVRSPWIAVAMAETLRSLDGWPHEEWQERYAQLTLERSTRDRLDEIRRGAAPILADELKRWR